jgi:glycosyltransferase involved in cell wall biosynthesis
MKSKNATVWIFSFNHQDYIEQCLDSVISQQYSDRIQIIWFDDASTDSTVQRGERLLRGSSVDVHRLHMSRNVHSRAINPIHLLEHYTATEFVFIMDGDDFWIDNRKVTIQTEALQTLPQINVCFTRARVCTERGDFLDETIGDLSENGGIVPISSVIRGDGGLMHTGSIGFRRRVLDEAPKFYWQWHDVGDYKLQVCASMPNGALYLPIFASAYRKGTPNSWTTRMSMTATSQIDYRLSFIKLLTEMKASFPVAHSSDFDFLIRSKVIELFRLAIDASDFLTLHTALSHVVGVHPIDYVSTVCPVNEPCPFNHTRSTRN